LLPKNELSLHNNNALLDLVKKIKFQKVSKNRKIGNILHARLPIFRSDLSHTVLPPKRSKSLGPVGVLNEEHPALTASDVRSLFIPSSKPVEYTSLEISKGAKGVSGREKPPNNSFKFKEFVEKGRQKIKIQFAFVSSSLPI
jgi:hypothetical protein